MIDGPAYCSAARPVTVKMPAPMMTPRPYRVSSGVPSTRRNPADFCCVPVARFIGLGAVTAWGEMLRFYSRYRTKTTLKVRCTPSCSVIET